MPSTTTEDVEMKSSRSNAPMRHSADYTSMHVASRSLVHKTEQPKVHEMAFIPSDPSATVCTICQKSQALDCADCVQQHSPRGKVPHQTRSGKAVLRRAAPHDRLDVYDRRDMFVEADCMHMLHKIRYLGNHVLRAPTFPVSYVSHSSIDSGIATLSRQCAKKD
jgi:hypothetical protein